MHAPITAALRRVGNVRGVQRLGVARRTWRDAGAVATASLLVQRLLPPGIGHFHWDVLMEEPCRAGTREPVPHVRTWLVSPADITRLTTLGRNREDLLARLAAGHGAMAIDYAGEIAGMSWWHTGDHVEDGIRFRLAEDEAWIYDDLVDARLRGRGLLAVLRGDLSEHLRRRGVRRLLCAVEQVNSPALRAAANRDARVLGSLMLLSVGGSRVAREAWGDGPSWRFRLGAGELDLGPVRQSARPRGRSAATPADRARRP